MMQNGLRAGLRRLFGRLHPDDGQVFALMLPMIGIFFVSGVLAVEVGLAYSDRRDAQATVDHAARAGAVELNLDAAQTSVAADAAAVQYLTLNGYKRR